MLINRHDHTIFFSKKHALRAVFPTDSAVWRLHKGMRFVRFAAETAAPRKVGSMSRSTVKPFDLDARPFSHEFFAKNAPRNEGHAL